MGFLIFAITAGCFLWIVRKVIMSSRHAKQIRFIDSYRFHTAIKNKVHEKHQYLDEEQIDIVFQGLKDYFWMCQQAQIKSKKNMVAMPSQLVDDAWHEFILFTKSYEAFCSKSIGTFLHHTPTEAMPSATSANEGIKRAWRLACAKEFVNPDSPQKMPLIFDIDSRFNVPNGFKYSLNCKNSTSPNYSGGYCASHIGCASGCSGSSSSSADTSASGGFFSSDGDSSGCSGGCGGGD